jgi:hypothetical protein
MDLSLIKVKDSITVEIVHPDLEGVSFEMAGPSHPKTLKSNREFQDRLPKMRGKKLTSDELNAMGNESLANRVISWKGIDWEGQPMECNAENALAILSNKNLSFISDQLSRAMGDTESFFSK